MKKMMTSIEQFWDELLSQDPNRIRKTFEDLNDDDRQSVVEHLTKMTTEESWHPSQIRSAQIALDTINTYMN